METNGAGLPFDAGQNLGVSHVPDVQGRCVLGICAFLDSFLSYRGPLEILNEINGLQGPSRNAFTGFPGVSLMSITKV